MVGVSVKKISLMQSKRQILKILIFLKKKYSLTKLFASEKKVGLPVGQFGNSEVGHMNIGGGRIILQDILRIEKCFKILKLKNQDFLKNGKKLILQLFMWNFIRWRDSRTPRPFI